MPDLTLAQLKKAYDSALEQIAAESFLEKGMLPSLIIDRLRIGNNPPGSAPSEPILDGKLRMTLEQAQAFESRYIIIDAYQNDATGFSAVALRDTANLNRVVLAVRSTEILNDRARDVGADFQIFTSGFAFDQILSAQDFLARVQPQLLPGEKIDLVGYSLSGNVVRTLAAMYPTEVNQTSGANVVFNATGLGGFSDPTGQNRSRSVVLLEMMALYRQIETDPNSVTDVPLLLQPLQLTAIAAPPIDRTDPNSNVYPSPRNDFAEAYVQNKYTTFYNDFGTTVAEPSFAQYFGVALSGFDAAAVSNSGSHPVPIGVAIEGQPVVEIPGVASKFDYLNTHSLTLIADSLRLQVLFKEIDPNLSMDDIQTIFQAASATSASTLMQTAEGDTLEKALDPLRMLFLGPTIAPLTLPSSNDPGSFGNIVNRTVFYNAIAAVETALNSQTYQVASLVGQPSETIKGNALLPGATGTAYRYALKELNPFVVLGANYTQFNNPGDLDLYDPETGNGSLTLEYVKDRATFLEKKIQVNRSAFPSVSGTLSLSHFKDNQSGYEIGASAAPLPQIIFGNSTDEIIDGSVIWGDRLYGGDGADTINGNFGADYLEGNAGNDTLLGGSGNDTLVGQQGIDTLEGGADNDILDGGPGNDILRGGTGNDQYIYRLNDGQDTIEDEDNIGSIVFADRRVFGGIRRDGDPANTYTSPDGRFTFTKQDTDLVITGSGPLTIHNYNFDTGTLGIKLANAPNAQTPTAPTIDYGANGFPALTVNAPGDGAGYTIERFGAVNYTLNGNVGTDVLVSDLGNDQLFGFGNNDQLFGRSGDDLLDGGLGNDQLNGGVGNDVLYGGAGDDVLNGADELGDESGADYLDGGDGLDILLGGAGDDVLLGGAGDDQLSGEGLLVNGSLSSSTGNDFLDGGDGNDGLTGFAGDDILLGGAGNDLLSGDNLKNSTQAWDSAVDGADYLDGGAGDDELNGGGKDDILLGGAGNDVLYGEGIGYVALAGNDWLEGEDGDDQLYGGLGADALFGGAGADLLVGDFVNDAGADDTLDGGEGNDELRGGGGQDLLDGGSENDLLFGEAGDDSLYGGTGDDQLAGGEGNDVLAGGAGVDQLYGDAGADDLSGGLGDDLLSGGADDDTLFGDEGNDELQGGLGADLLVGGEGNDRLFGQEGADELVGDSGSDVLVGGADADQLFGGGDDDVLQGEDGNDVLYGDQGNDQLVGGTGDDTLIGGEGDDILIADDGADVIEGGAGNDVLIGGEGRDTYVYTAGDGADSISDFVDAGGTSNTIRFGAGITSDQLTVGMSDGVLMLRMGTAGDTITLGAVDPNDVSSFRDFDSFQLADSSTVTFTQLVDRGISLTGTAGNNVLIGTNVADRISGLDGDDTLLGRAGDDVLDGGAGNDFLDGEAGSDTYLFGHGSGRDNLTESDFTTVNTIQLGADVSPGELAVRRGGPLLFLDLASTNDRVTISDFFLDAAHQNFQARFADGTLWDAARLIFESRIVRGTEGPDNLSGANNSDDIVLGLGGDDLLSGLSGDDILEGGRGDDQLNGGVGNDTYRFNQGDGQDTIRDTLTGSQTNTVVFGPGITPDSISLGGAVENNFPGSSLLIRVGTGGDALVVGNFNPLDAATPQTISQYQFSDGTILTHSQLMARGFDLFGTDGDDVLIGTNLSDRFTGGAGNDVLKGGEGDDTYFFGRGAGQDQVVDFKGSLDVVRMAADILPSDVTVTRNGRDLVVGLIGSQDRLTVTGWFLAQTLQIEQIQFADGTIWDTTFLQNLTQRLIRGTDAADVLTGTSDDDRIEGLGGNDQLTGLAGHDLLDGGTGADQLNGGSGDDLYVVDDAGDVVTELANEGMDTIQSSVTHALSANVEQLTLTGTAAINGTGNALDNILTGNSAANVLTGGLGNDTYAVGTGDTVVELPGEGTDTVQSAITYTLGANLENLTLTGSASINGTGNNLDNVLMGNASVNILAGGAGNDTYVVGLGDQVIEAAGEGIDTVASAESYTLGANVENLTLLDTLGTLVIRLIDQGGLALFDGTAGTATGNELDNVLIGNAGSNVLDGQAGADTMAGGQGGDLYRVDNAGDIVLEGSSAGRDSVESTLSYTLGAHLENLTLTGISSIDGTGNELDNVLTGNDAANVLDGGAGNDRLQGGAGADTYRFGHGYGLDQIYDVSADQNIIQMTPDVAPNQVIVRQYISPGFGVISGLVLDISGAPDKLFVPGFFDFPGLQRVEFADGTVWDRQTLITLAGVNSSDTTNWNAVLQQDEPRSPILGTEVGGMLQGTAGNDDLRGLAGDDTIFGLGGDDRLSGNEGADLLIGGPGDDIYEYVDDLDSVIESQGEGTDSIIGPVSTTTASYVLPANVENLLSFVSFVGGGGNSVQGNDLDNVIIGSASDDVLDGGAGNDTLIGGTVRMLEGPPYFAAPGNDLLIGGLGNDRLVAVGDNFTLQDVRPHSGDDVLIGGPGDDTYALDHAGHVVVELAGEGSDTVETFVNYTLGENVENLTFVSETGSVLTGTGNVLDNVMVGNADDNVLNGLDGADTLAGGQYGNDTLIGGIGDDTYLFNVGDGIDTIDDTATAGEGNRIQFGAGISQSDLTFTQDQIAHTLTIQVGSSGTDQILLTNFDPTNANGSLVVETLAFADGSTASLASLLGLGGPVATSGDDTITTGAGDDVVDALGGNDIVDTGAGNDTITGGLGNDQLTGGTGNDTYLFNIGDGVDTITDTAVIGEGNTVEFGTGITPTDLTLGLGSLLIRVGTNGDAIHLTPFDPNDALGTHAIETFRFADGTTLSYSQLLARGFDLAGTAGNDVITGTNVVDRISGLAGNDTYDVDNVGDVVIEQLNDGTDTVQSSVSYVLDANVENLTLMGTSAIDGTGNELANVLTGNSAANVLAGGDGNDTLTGNAGNDILNGGVGADSLSGGDGDDTLYVDSADTSIDGGAGTDVLTVVGTVGVTLNVAAASIEVGIGSDGNDTFNGAAATTALSLDGGAGDDMLTGGSGNDVLAGGLGNDQLTGNGGNDVLNGGAGADVLSGGDGDDLLYIDAEDTSISGGLGQDAVSVLPGSAGVTLDVATASIEDAMGGDGNDTFNGTNATANLLLQGNGGNDTLLGGAGTDALNGGSGNDLLNGGVGADILIGGTGDDTYVVDDPGDQLTENLNEGLESVQSSISYVLGVNVENLTLTGTANLNGTGNALNNSLTGNSGNNVLDGGTGADTMIGGAGNDIYIVDNVSDVVMEQVNEGTDTVQSSLTYALGANVENLTLTGAANLTGTGNALNNVLTGNSGDNILDGGTGADTLVGGLGNDTYVVDNIGDVVTEQLNEGTDTVQSTISYTLGANLENLTLTGTTAINGTGNALNNMLTGNSAVNVLDGGTGADTLVGGAGSDTYVVDNIGDVVTENLNEGTDTVQSSVTYTIGANVENLTLTGTTAINGTGNALNNALFGSSGNNVLDGGAGVDTLVGGQGNDTYVVDNVGDLVTENANEGTDTVQSSVTYTLGSNLENLTLTGSAAINGTGNSVNNALTGNNAANVLDGGAGADTLAGLDGNDTYVVDNAGDAIIELANNGTDLVQSSVTYTLAANVENLTLTGTAVINGTGNTLDNVLIGNSAANTLTGGAGNDMLNGGTGADTLVGGTGNDTYVVDATGDVVTELTNEGTDTVQSSVTYTLAANVENLTLTGTAAINGTSNALDNILAGNSAANTLTGGAGNDTYVVSTGDTVVEAGTAGTDTVQSDVSWTLGANLEALTLTGTANLNGTGNALDNLLTGNSGANVLTGGAGNDVYVVSTGDTVVEAATAGTDTVLSDVTQTLAANVEILVLTGTSAINGTGNSLNNALTGNNAANVLDGGAGADTLTGLDGNDTYLVDNTGDAIIELANNGTDLVQSSVTYTLAANVENLTQTGTTAINGTGNTLDNVLIGNSANNTLTGGAGNDTLDGGAGNDTMLGGTGNDTYVVTAAGDVVTENANEGTDTVQSSITYTLGANVENLTLTGTAVINGTGNTLNNILAGNSGNNTLTGGAGNDTLTGGAGSDILVGGAGNDTYLVNRGDGQETIQDADGTAGNADKLLYGTTINPLDLVLGRQANDLRLAIHGGIEQVTIQNWYTSPSTNQVETIQAGNGQTLLSTQVDQLIQAMAGFTQQTGLTWDQAIDQRPQDVQTVLAASWQ